jgi:uncharacterized protein (DUF362 family)
MHRRTFLQTAAVPVLAKAAAATPEYRVKTPFPSKQGAGMPGKYRGTVVRVESDRVVDIPTERVDRTVAGEMLARGMTTLTGARDAREAWASFFEPSDVVGIKVNCSGSPNIMSTPELVGEIVANLVKAGVKPQQICIYERFLDQLTNAHYERHVPEGVSITAVETPRGSILGYDPKTYVEVSFFGEDDTRSNMVRMVTERFTKIINVPNLKDHQASGVTGCLKNIAYGNYSNVARSHLREKTNTLSFIGTLASVEPLRSKTVLNVMDGFRGVWHGGPFSNRKQFRFYPQQLMIGTDPVAMDRLLIDVIEEKRKKEGARSVWDRSTEQLTNNPGDNVRMNRFIREPGHIEFAGGLGLGLYDKAQIQLKSVKL